MYVYRFQIAVCRYILIHRGEVSPGGTVSVEVWWAKHEKIPDLKCFLWSPSESALDGDEEKEFEDVFMELVEIQPIGKISEIKYTKLY